MARPKACPCKLVAAGVGVLLVVVLLRRSR
jgi:hypothetical protein